MSGWHLNPAYAPLQADFGSLDAVFALQGERLTLAPRSEVIRVERAGVRYYVKRYGANADKKNWRRKWARYLRRYALAFLPHPRIKAEWQNLKQFAKWGIPVPEIVAWGMERRFGAFYRGALITRELPDSVDLNTLAQTRDPRLHDRPWVACIMRQVAAHARTLHTHHFAHNDLKWRNILVDKADKVWFIDCPLGNYWFGPLLAYRQSKDIACLDKVARQCLSATQRLRFYRLYRGLAAGVPLDAAEKSRIRHILRFFVEET
ncbi:MAG: lipopolysaccharide kinase InaA family protein [Zoogloeaceae bacterium]|jgi:tRNA A-37 threonylcarbamoyl transferase component Bud32|nr:lipopolysaccharide kinase InaA family protein [Zoogloeaceae bacterium]